MLSLMRAVALLLLMESAASAAPIRGMTVSCPRWGEIWGTEEMGHAVRELAALGVEWVAIHPYGGIRRDGQIVFHDPARTGYLLRSVPLSTSAGMKIFWTPHIAHWGTFEWRGSIEFGDDREAWKRFFTDYEAFIVAHARFAEQNGLPLFSVGIEYEKTMQYEKEWRRIIAAVRKVYRGQITYAANWDGVERVPFWDAVDLIGVQAYFPLASGEAPSERDLTEAWKRIWERLGAVSKKHRNKKILFTEIGYPRSRKAALEPWAPDLDESPGALLLRRRLLEVAFQELDHPLLAGAFWWKWIPGSNRWDRDFSMRDEEAIQALTAHWRVLSAPAPQRR
jgi:hypothetical protein